MIKKTNEEWADILGSDYYSLEADGTKTLLFELSTEEIIEAIDFYRKIKSAQTTMFNTPEEYDYEIKKLQAELYRRLCNSQFNPFVF
jgi:hypothetical protein